MSSVISKGKPQDPERITIFLWFMQENAQKLQQYSSLFISATQQLLGFSFYIWIKTAVDVVH